MTLQSKHKITYITRFLLMAMLLIVASVSAAAQTNTFPSTGNAGVGTTTFDAGTSGLQIQPASRSKFGVLVTDIDGSRSGGLYVDSDGFGQLYLFDSGGTIRVHIAASSQDHTYFNSGGNVGIGTNTPSQKLNVIGNGLFGNLTNRTLLYSTYDSQQNSFLEVGYGTSHSAITPFPAFVLSNNTTSTSNAEGIIGQIAFANRSIADNNDKRTAIITSWVDGASNSGTLQFYTSSAGTLAERLRINSAGNVGIGTSSPGNYKLNVSGPLFGTSTFTSYIADGLYGATALPSRISTHNYNGGILFGYEDLGLGDYSPRVGLQQTYDVTASPNITSTKASIGLVRNGNITIRGGASHTEFFRIDNSGNVGIGTPNPGAKLHLSAGDSSFALFGPNSSWAGSLAVGSGNAFLTPVSGRAQVLSSNGNLHLDAGTNQFVFIGWLNASNTIINGQGGNVGVGTSTPSYKLDVQGGQINSSGGLCIAGDCKTAWSQVGGGGSSQWTGTSSIYYNGGNVGIGTTSPTNTLQVNGSVTIGATTPAATTGVLNIQNGRPNLTSAAGLIYIGSGLGTNFSGLTFQGSVASDMFFGRAPSVDDLVIATATVASPVELVRFKQNGNVGIGTPSPTKKLHVAGDIQIDGNINAKYQDLAEWVPSSEHLSPGTVVVLDTTKSNQVVSSSTAYDTRVAGVISAQPGITLGEGGEGKVLVATTGRVRVKVDASRGAIQIGDLLVTSDITGVGMKSEAVNLGGVQIHRPGTIIGKALEPLAKGSGEILVLLSLQ